MKITSTILLTVLTLALGACSDDYLELSPINQANTANFYQTEEDFETALIGTYGTLMGQSFADRLVLLLDIRSDNGTAAGNFGSAAGISEFNASPTAGDLQAVYSNSYEGIQAANAILERIDPTDVDGEVKQRIKGEASFVRALYYFYLTALFGDVPLITAETTGDNIGETREFTRTPVDDVHAQVIADLQFAEGALPDDNVSGRASAGAAKAFLGKVYLFRQQYSEAATKLKEVIDLNQYSLEPDYTELFAKGNADNAEDIFVVQHIGSAEGTGSRLPYQFAPLGSTPGGVLIFQQLFYVEENLFRSFSEEDIIRRKMAADSIFTPGGDLGDTLYFSQKYVDNEPFELQNGDANMYILRYADVLLMYAEALNAVSYQAGSEAFQYLNAVRTRVGLDALSATDLPDQQAFADHLLEERRHELAFEGHRWLDLLRTGKALETINAVRTEVQIDNNDLLYPIPQSEVLNNPERITQNPGY